MKGLLAGRKIQYKRGRSERSMCLGDRNQREKLGGCWGNIGREVLGKRLHTELRRSGSLLGNLLQQLTQRCIEI